MLRWLAHDYHTHTVAAHHTLIFSNMGNPLAQQRHVDRLIKRMGHTLLSYNLQTGKRGKFSLHLS
jgi:hypothetical protein